MTTPRGCGPSRTTVGDGGRSRNDETFSPSPTQDVASGEEVIWDKLGHGGQEEWAWAEGKMLASWDDRREWDLTLGCLRVSFVSHA